MDPEKTMRDELTAAFDSQVEEAPKDDKIVASDNTIVETPVSGVEVPTPGEPNVDSPSTDIPVVAVDAPVSLKAAEKAEWAKAPKVIQEAFLRREQEVQTALRGSSEARKLAEEFSQTVGPYLPMIRAANSTPMVAFKNLMNTAAGLTMGTAQQKAQIVRDIIQNYQVDVQTLDQVLSNNLPAAGKGAPGSSDVEVHIQKAIAPIYEFMNSLQGQRQQNQQRMEQDAERAVEKFRSQNEFFEDLREEVADLMEVAAGRGREMTIQQAYEIAVSMNPTVKAAVQQKAAAGNQGAAERAQRAALSISGNPAGSPPRDPNANSMRDDLMNAWSAAQ